MSKTAAKKKSEVIRENLAVVQIFARTGRLPIISDDVEYIGPGIPPVKRPGVVLDFVDGVCTLDPVRDAKTIEVFNEWMADGSDERIHQLGVTVVAKDALLPPFPKWDTTKAENLPQIVEDLGLDPERCLRYELGKGKDARAKLVKFLEARVDAPPVADPDAEPTL